MRIWLTLTVYLLAATSASAGLDVLSQARMAAIEGQHAKCAELADKARREQNAVWHAHHVYATCKIYATEAAKDKISNADYVAGIQDAIDSFKFLVETPGLLVSEEQRGSVYFMIEELNKRIAPAEKE